MKELHEMTNGELARLKEQIADEEVMRNFGSTGIVRRIDELGRVVIPREVRRALRISEGDPMAIYFDNRKGVIMLQKYVPVDDEDED